jgi:hypothetical protein
VDGWVRQLPDLGRQGAALAFLQGAEYRTGVFTGYYKSLLHRPADLPGLDGWVFSNLDIAAVRLGVEGSIEFFLDG